ncbi:MAG: tetratricopeptide repeat protein [Vicinamibacteria bacterium]
MNAYVKASALVLSIVSIGCMETSYLAGNGPCVIALTPHLGETSEDVLIARLQEKAVGSHQPLAHLERLGWAFVAKARASYDPGYYKLAEQTALCLESKKPDRAAGHAALLLRGHVLHNLHRFAEAEVLARNLVAERGLSFDYGLLGDVLLEQGELDEAIAAYQRMMDQKPSPQAYARSAHVRWLKGDLAGAIEAMRMAAGASGAADAESAAWAQARLAMLDLQAGDLPLASRVVADALALRPGYAPALLVRGRILLAEGKTTEAISSLREAARLNPLPEYHWFLLEALEESEDVLEHQEEARAVAEALTDRGALDDPRTFALYLATTGNDPARALALAEEELETRADVFTLDALAWALHASGRNEEASVFSSRALAEGTRDARLLLHAGVIAAGVGEKEEAARLLEDAGAIEQMLLPSERKRLHLERITLNDTERSRT